MCIRDSAKEDNAAALSDLAEAIRLAPTSGQYYAHRGQIRAATGELDLAIADFDAAVRFDANGWVFHRERAQLYMLRSEAEPASRAQDLLRAKESLDSIVRGGAPEAADYEKRGLVLERMGLVKEAIADLRIALAQDKSLEESRAALKRLGAAQ